MPKFPTFPTLYEDVLQISVTKLKKWGYLEKPQIKSGVITWSRNGEEFASISVVVNTLNEKPYIQLDYRFNGEPRKYKVYFDTDVSNIGNGEIWYFVCPQTNKRCRKLYQIQGYFFHREAFKSCYYEKQIQSKYARSLEKNLGAWFKSDKLYSELYSKHFRSQYNGKPTKRYLKLMKQIQEAESIPLEEIHRAMIK